MIFELIVKALAAVARGVASLFDSLTLPQWWLDVDEALESVADYGAGMSSWIPWVMIFNAVAFVFVCAAITYGIKLVRILLSVFTGGGGSAA